eukprot:CAMPEP_0179909844 /NCGR_PEP_ID=MMETSP0982-20121206/45448_1 /TAXON_ID=483367 /ORGANISM="non described non described, Strain CCMP 2436" /LENGTH=872 /DNA_ID=CAMNT_0021811353 /DNA_START=1 /DNA_END=2616 /DNA_ORIENTATION=+
MADVEGRIAVLNSVVGVLRALEAELPTALRLDAAVAIASAGSRARARAVRRMSKGSGGESRGGSQPQTPVRAGGGAAGSPARVGALRVRVPGSQGAVSESGSQSHPDWLESGTFSSARVGVGVSPAAGPVLGTMAEAGADALFALVWPPLRQLYCAADPGLNRRFCANLQRLRLLPAEHFGVPARLFERHLCALTPHNSINVFSPLPASRRCPPTPSGAYTLSSLLSPTPRAHSRASLESGANSTPGSSRGPATPGEVVSPGEDFWSCPSTPNASRPLSACALSGGSGGGGSGGGGGGGSGSGNGNGGFGSGFGCAVVRAASAASAASVSTQGCHPSGASAASAASPRTPRTSNGSVSGGVSLACPAEVAQVDRRTFRSIAVVNGNESGRAATGDGNETGLMRSASGMSGLSLRESLESAFSAEELEALAADVGENGDAANGGQGESLSKPGSADGGRGPQGSALVGVTRPTSRGGSSALSFGRVIALGRSRSAMSTGAQSTTSQVDSVIDSTALSISAAGDEFDSAVRLERELLRANGAVSPMGRCLAPLVADFKSALGALNTSNTPREKLKVIERACDAVTQHVLSLGTIGADELLPLIAYALVHAAADPHPPAERAEGVASRRMRRGGLGQKDGVCGAGCALACGGSGAKVGAAGCFCDLLSHMHFASDFIQKEDAQNRGGYALTTLQAAAFFVVDAPVLSEQSASPPPLASSAAAAATALVSAVVAKPTTTRSMAAKTGVGGAEVQAGEQVGVAHLMAAGLGDCPYGTSAQRGQGGKVLRSGDHIRRLVRRSALKVPLWHHGLFYGGGGRLDVIHLAHSGRPATEATVVFASLSDFADGGLVERVDHAHAEPTHVVLERAAAQLGTSC